LFVPSKFETDFRVTMKNSTIGEMAEAISNIVKLPVLESTGLVGRFNTSWDLHMAEVDVKSSEAMVEVVFESLKSLGLAVKKARVTVTGLVVDKLSELIEN